MPPHTEQFPARPYLRNTSSLSFLIMSTPILTDESAQLAVSRLAKCPRYPCLNRDCREGTAASPPARTRVACVIGPNQWGKWKRAGGQMSCKWESKSSADRAAIFEVRSPPRSMMMAHTPSPGHNNPAMCIKGFVLLELAAEHPRVTMLFIFPLS